MLNGVPRILIIRLSAIGDVVRVLPALHALRDQYPHAQIDWAVEPKSATIVEGHPALDRCLVFERTADSGFLPDARVFREYCRMIRDSRYDIVVDFHGIFKSGLIVRASKAKQRLGFAPPRSQEMSHLFYTERVKLISNRMNRIDENLELCKVLGAKRHHLDVVIGIDDEIRNSVEGHVDSLLTSGKKLAMVHAPVERPGKQWPLEHFSALADMILADGRFEVMLTWGPGQRHIAEKVYAGCRRNPVIAHETPDLKHFAALVQQAHVFCGGDTGPMHIASAMGVPVVAIFGGTDPQMHAPMRKPSVVLYEGPDPRPEKLDLETANACLRKVEPETVYDACIRIAAPQRVGAH